MLGTRTGDDRLPWPRHHGAPFVSCHETREGVDWVPDCLTPGSMGGSECEAPSRPCAEPFQGALTAAFSTESTAPVLLPYQFRMEEIEGFRYRCRVSGTGWGAE